MGRRAYSDPQLPHIRDNGVSPHQRSPIDDYTAPHRSEPWRVLWTRGKGCAHLAEIVSGGTATKAEDDLKTACISHRANVVVTSKAHSFEFASTLVPQSIDEASAPPTVVGAVGTGPHSPLVAETTARLAAGYGAHPILVTMAGRAHEEDAAQRVLTDLALLAPGAETQLVHADTAGDLVASLPESALLVLGAPGGSWWQRQFFGPGRRLMHAAPAGSVVVRAAPRRCFHSIEEITPVGAPMLAHDAAAVIGNDTAPVVAAGKVIGLVRRADLEAAPGDATVESVMSEPVVVAADDLITSIGDLADHLDGAPIPVVDSEGRLLGGVRV